MATYSIRHPLAAGAEIAEGDLWTFPEGLIGFPALRRFALLELEQAPPFRLLASVDEPAFGLVIVDPRTIVPGYELALSEGDLTPLEVESAEQLEVCVLVTIPADGTPFSLNLRAPVVLSGARRRGVQRTSSDESHAFRYTPDSSGIGTPSCSS